MPTLLSWDEVNALVERITYKEGWSIILVPGRECEDPSVALSSDFWLHVGALVPDSRGAKYLRQISWRKPIGSTDLISKEVFLNFVYRSIRGLEIHEMDEWFAFDGALVNDPHPVVSA